MILRLFIIFYFSFFIINVNANNKEKIVTNLKNTSNLSFKFEQNINGEIENGRCIIEYPKKIYCSYEKNNKVLVSNGKSVVIKTLSITASRSRYIQSIILDCIFYLDRCHVGKEPNRNEE